MASITDLSLEAVASIAHAANQRLQYLLDESVARDWDELGPSEKRSVVAGVEEALQPGITPERMHDVWRDDKRSKGWTLGPLDREGKTHPNMVPYAALPEAQKVKDELFLGIVHSLCH